MRDTGMKRILMAAFLIGFSAQAGTKTLEGRKVLAFAYALNQGVETSRYATHMMELLKYGECRPSYWTDETDLEFRYSEVSCVGSIVKRDRDTILSESYRCAITRRAGSRPVQIEGGEAEALLDAMSDIGLESDAATHKFGYAASDIVIHVNPKKLVTCGRDSGVRVNLNDWNHREDECEMCRVEEHMKRIGEEYGENPPDPMCACHDACGQSAPPECEN